jgi:hypothetical protein
MTAPRRLTAAIYRAMLYRCSRPTHPNYARYGGRGIAVCARWADSFDNFLEDMGLAPKGMVLDRKDNDGNYEPANCRWISPAESARNTSRTRFITHDGKTLCLKDWAAEVGMGRMTLTKRLESGWPPALALSVPVRNQRA